ncbi:MAG: hypothetical protein R3C30_06440 [Hyphomonadaceae bacterium]
MRAVLIIFAVFASVPLVIALMVAGATLMSAPDSTDALQSMPLYLIGAAAISAFILGSGVIVALVLRSLERRQG